MESFISSYVSPVETPIMSNLEEVHYLVRDSFYIDFQYTQVFLPLKLNATTTTSWEQLLIPFEILCNCNDFTVKERDPNIASMYALFFMVPIDVLDVILPQMGKCAREMVENKNEERDILEMDVLLHVTTIEMAKEEEDRKNQTNYEFVRIVNN
ncbi:uncharacterized protein LOC127123230 [Lathyrus oleraceus]|uniref:uncharacterized protein LOC127123230 n=1 Tax=Pisum sativum TaxID=3888 RepID=UPI0021D004FC|nr:uncharacterized protein LOC127123230 [Pisum sativum]